MDVTRPKKRSRTSSRSYARATVRRPPKSLSAVHPAQGLVGKKRKTLLRYVAFTSLNAPTSGVPDSHIFRANGLYDPDARAGGHQPRGFDQMTALYKKYRVLKACIEVWTMGANATEGHNVVLTLRNDDNIPSTGTSLLEDPEAVISHSMIQNGVHYSKKEVSMRTYATDFDKDDYVGTESADPNEQLFFHVAVYPVGGATSAGDVDATIRITYEAEFFDPQIPPIS